MKLMIAISAAVIVGVSIYGISDKLDTAYQIGLRKTGGWVSSPVVILATALGTVCCLIHVLVSYDTITIPEMLTDMIIIVGMGILSITDYYKKTVPNKIILILLVIWLVITGVWFLTDYVFPQNAADAANQGSISTQPLLGHIGWSVIGAVVAGLIFLLCYVISKGKLGAGDVKLSAVMGLYLTAMKVIGAILYGCIICLIVSLVLVFRKKLTMKDGIPFVPFLYLGTVITFLIV